MENFIFSNLPEHIQTITLGGSEHTLRRLIATNDISVTLGSRKFNVKKGAVCGWAENEDCIKNGALVLGNAAVFAPAVVSGKNCVITDKAIIYGNAKVTSGSNGIEENGHSVYALVKDLALVLDNASVTAYTGAIEISGNAVIKDYSTITIGKYTKVTPKQFLSLKKKLNKKQHNSANEQLAPQQEIDEAEPIECYKIIPTQMSICVGGDAILKDCATLKAGGHSIINRAQVLCDNHVKVSDVTLSAQDTVVGGYVCSISYGECTPKRDKKGKKVLACPKKANLSKEITK